MPTCASNSQTPARSKNPSLVFYTPVRALADRLIVTNGDQTETIFETIQAGRSFRQALDTRRFEPDAPHYTPRISALLARDGIDLSIVRRAGCDGSCLRRYWHFAPVPGQGHLLHTYQQNGTPLPPFIGAPRPLATPQTPQRFVGPSGTPCPGTTASPSASVTPILPPGSLPAA